MEYTAAFLRIVMAASPVYILASVMALLLRADGCIRLSSAVLVAAGVANVVFDLLFMGALGFGIEGSALATDAGMLAAVLLSLLYFRWPHRTLHLRWAALCGLGASSAAILKSGAQSALRILFSCVSRRCPLRPDASRSRGKGLRRPRHRRNGPQPHPLPRRWDDLRPRRQSEHHSPLVFSERRTVPLKNCWKALPKRRIARSRWAKGRRLMP